MLSIRTTDVIEKRPGGDLCGSEVHISGAYNRLMGEYEALSMCFINQILQDCGDHDVQLEFASNYTEIINRLVSHLIEEVSHA